MTQEQKELLLKDLCGRLPHGVKVNNEIQGDFEIYGICENIVFGRNEVCHIDFDVEKIKPYLFPLSSMTEEQKNDCPINETNLNIINSNIGCYGIIEMPWRLSFLFIDWCNKNHLDYRGLIPMGMAIDATDKNIY
jgi:hypothetical protein